MAKETTAGVETPPEGTDLETPPEGHEPPQRPTPFKDKMDKLRAELEEEEAGGAEPPEGGEGEEEEELEGDFVDLPGQEAGGEEEELAGEGEGEEEAEEEAGEGEGEEGEEDDDVVFLALPARREGEEDFELPLDIEFLEEAGLDPADVVERVNQLRNGAMRRAEFDEAIAGVQAEQDELDGIYAELEADPSGFILESVNPQVRTELTEQLVLSLDEQAFDALIEKMQTWGRRPETREAAKAKAEVERLRGARKRTTEREASKQTNQEVRAVANAIKGLIPEGMADARADRFVRTAAMELRRHVADNKLTTLDPAQVPELLGQMGVLEDYGISADGDAAGGEAAAEASSQQSSSQNGQTARKKGSKAGSRSKAKGADVRERLKRRKAAATTPGGAGAAAPTGFQKVRGEKYADRRNRLARAMGLPEKDFGEDD